MHQGWKNVRVSPGRKLHLLRHRSGGQYQSADKFLPVYFLHGSLDFRVNHDLLCFLDDVHLLEGHFTVWCNAVLDPLNAKLHGSRVLYFLLHTGRQRHADAEC